MEVRIYVAFRAVINRKASIRHHRRLGQRDIPLSIRLAHAFNVVCLRERSSADVEVTCDSASCIVVQRSFICAFESVFGRVEQRESKFVKASTVCAAYAEIDNLTAHYDLVSRLS